MDKRVELLKLNYRKIDEECTAAAHSIRAIQEQQLQLIKELTEVRNANCIINISNRQHSALSLLFGTNLKLEAFLDDDPHEMTTIASSSSDAKSDISLSIAPITVSHVAASPSKQKLMEVADNTEIKECDVHLQDRCYITCYINPTKLYIQVINNSYHLLDGLMVKLNDVCRTGECNYTKSQLSKQIGKYCAAYVEGWEYQWHRAEVLDWMQVENHHLKNAKISDSEFVRVLLIDYGNIVEIPYKSLRVLPFDMFNIPKFARCCHLTNTPAINCTTTQLLDDCFKIVFIYAMPNSLAIDLLSENETDPKNTLSKILCRQCGGVGDNSAIVAGETLIKSQPTPALGETFKVLLTHFVSLNEIYGRLEDNPEQMQQLNKKIKSAIGILEHYTDLPWANEMLIARHWDSEWYRGRVVSVDEHDKTVNVFFVDSGETCSVALPNLRKMPTPFLEIPFQAIALCLANITPNKQYAKAAEDFFKRKYILKHLNAQLVYQISRDKWVVELFNIKNGSISAEMVQLQFADTSPTNEFLLSD